MQGVNLTPHAPMGGRDRASQSFVVASTAVVGTIARWMACPKVRALFSPIVPQTVPLWKGQRVAHFAHCCHLARFQKSWASQCHMLNMTVGPSVLSAVLPKGHHV